MKFVVLFVLANAAIVCAQGKEVSEKFEEIDLSFKQVYNGVLEKYKADTVFIRKLELAQKEWEKSCEADLVMIFPYKDTDRQQSTYGTMFSICYLIQWMDLIQERTKFLRKWLDAEYSEPCSGSIGRWRNK